MKLQEFVKQTLLDITNGVFTAQSEAPTSIAPGVMEGEKITAPQMVSFEVAITASKEGSSEINILSTFDAGGKIASEHINKISFAVPIYFNALNQNKNS